MSTFFEKLKKGDEVIIYRVAVLNGNNYVLETVEHATKTKIHVGGHKFDRTGRSLEKGMWRPHLLEPSKELRDAMKAYQFKIKAEEKLKKLKDLINNPDKNLKMDLLYLENLDRQLGLLLGE